jgi:hypothetical protein
VHLNFSLQGDSNSDYGNFTGTFKKNELPDEEDFLLLNEKGMKAELARSGKSSAAFDSQWFDVETLLPIKLAIRAKFGNDALTEAEWNSSERNLPLLFHGLFFRRLCDMLGIVLSDQPAIFEAINGDPPPPVPMPYEFVEPHLLDLSVKIKTMHIVASR